MSRSNYATERQANARVFSRGGVMARARNIKPGFFKNELLAELDAFDRLLFIGLWCLADREGRVEDRPKRIKMELFPCDDYDVAEGLCSLAAAEFIRRYQACGIAVIAIVHFSKHQAPHGTERDSALPDENGMYTVHERGKNGYATGKTSSLTVKPQKSNGDCTGQKHPDSPIHRFTDSSSLPSQEEDGYYSRVHGVGFEVDEKTGEIVGGCA